MHKQLYINVNEKRMRKKNVKGKCIVWLKMVQLINKKKSYISFVRLYIIYWLYIVEHTNNIILCKFATNIFVEDIMFSM